LNQFIHINKMEDEYFVDNVDIYIEKKIVEKKFSYDSIIDDFKNMKKRWTIL